jgi:SAM-dependent methyltransferase
LTLVPESIQHADAELTLEQLPDGRRRLDVRMLDPEAHIWRTTCETSLPRDVIEALLGAHGPAGLCYVIDRIEDPTWVQTDIRQGMLSFIPQEQFAGKRLLDFGCGSGASTVNLARFFPGTDIVGVDLQPEFIDAARVLAGHFDLPRLAFVEAESPDSLTALGGFDFVVLDAVYEHLLPAERQTLMPELWRALSPGGVLFVMACPHRWYPLEFHTTALPLLNYMPDWLALRVARRFAGLQRRGIARDARWDDLLRSGIRGGTDREIVRNLRAGEEAEELQPIAYRDHVDLWYARSMARRPLPIKPVMRAAFTAITKLTGSTFVPSVTLAVRKIS